MMLAAVVAAAFELCLQTSTVRAAGPGLENKIDALTQLVERLEQTVRKQGERIGMIRFGSRAEVIVPDGFVPAVRVGDRVRAGETILARRQ